MTADHGKASGFFYTTAETSTISIAASSASAELHELDVTASLYAAYSARNREGKCIASAKVQSGAAVQGGAVTNAVSTERLTITMRISRYSLTVHLRLS